MYSTSGLHRRVATLLQDNGSSNIGYGVPWIGDRYAKWKKKHAQQVSLG